MKTADVDHAASRTFPEYTLLGLDVMFKVGSSHPDLDTLTDVLYCARKDDLGVIVVL